MAQSSLYVPNNIRTNSPTYTSQYQGFLKIYTQLNQ